MTIVLAVLVRLELLNHCLSISHMLRCAFNHGLKRLELTILDEVQEDLRIEGCW